MNIKELRKQLKKEVLAIDPVYWVENNLTIDGNPFLIHGSGRKYLIDIYRYIALNALKRDGKPVVIYKSRQVEASTMALALDSYFMASGVFGTSNEEEMERGVKRFPRIKVLHCFPQDKQTDRFIKEKATPFMNSARGDIVNKSKLKYGSDTDRIKQFNGDNSLFFESTGVDGNRLNNLSADVIFFDEFQDFLIDAISNTRMILKRARHGPEGSGAQIFFGTPREKGSFFERTWEMSDKRFFNLKCRKCNGYFPMFIPHTDTWKQIWLYGKIIACPLCGEHQDKIQAVNRGKWIPTGSKDAKYVGFHFNLFIHPDTTKEAVMSDSPENNATMTVAKWNNDILGQFYSGMGLPITIQEIADKCADKDREISTVGIPNIPTYLGLDWGKRVDGMDGGDSYSVAAIIEGHGEQIKVINAFKLKTREYEKKIEVVEEIYKRYNIRQGVGDMGYCEDLMGELQRRMMTKLLGWYNTVDYRDPYKYKKHEYYVFANKDRMIENVFELMKNGKIRIPFKDASYEKILFLLEHTCSMETKIKIVRGQPFTTYIKGNGPNDGLMALCYAILAYKFVITKGFRLVSNVMKIKQFQVKSATPLVIGGRVPRLR